MLYSVWLFLNQSTFLMPFHVPFVSRLSPACRSVMDFDYPLACYLNESTSLMYKGTKDQVPRTFHPAYQQTYTDIRKARTLFTLIPSNEVPARPYNQE